MLLTVLGMLGLVSLLATVLVGMTITAAAVSAKFRDDLDGNAAAETALERIVHNLQRNALAAGHDCYGSANLGGGHSKAFQETVTFPGGDTVQVVVDCDTVSPYVPNRDVTLDAYPDGAGDPVARARIEIVDEVGGLSRPGSEVRICDWQVGRNVRSTAQPCS